MSVKSNNGRYGAGYRPMRGSDRVLVCDEHGLLYGWRVVEAIKAKGSPNEVCKVEVDLEMYVAYLEVHFQHLPEIKAILERTHTSMSTDDLIAIDGLITLYEDDAQALAKIALDALSGKIPGIDPLDYGAKHNEKENSL